MMRFPCVQRVGRPEHGATTLGRLNFSVERTDDLRRDRTEDIKRVGQRSFVSLRPDEAAVTCHAKFDADYEPIGVAKDRARSHIIDVEDTADLARVRCLLAECKCAAARDYEQCSQSRQSRYYVMTQSVRDALGSL